MRTLATIRLAENHPCRVAFTDAFIDEDNRERAHFIALGYAFLRDRIGWK